METFNTIAATIHANGVVRIYGNGGMLYEVKGNYVKVETFVDPQPSIPSGEAAKKK